MTDLVAIRLQLQGTQETLDGLRRVKGELAGLGQSAGTAGRTGIQSMKRDIDGLAGSFASLVTAALGAKSAIEKFEAARNYRRALDFRYGEAKAARIDAQTTAFANRMGLPIASTRESMKRLAGTGEVEASQVVPTLAAFTAAAKVGGASTEGFKGAFRQYAEIASSGRLYGDELKIIQEWGVPLRQILKEAGLGDRIRGQGGGPGNLTFKEINEALLKFAERPDVKKLMEKYSQDPSAAFNRVQNQLNEKVWRPLGDNLAPSATKAADALASFADRLDEVSGTILGLAILAGGAGIAGKVAGRMAGRIAGGAAGAAVAGGGGAVATGAGEAIAAGAAGAGAVGAGRKAAGAARALLKHAIHGVGSGARFFVSPAGAATTSAMAITGGSGLALISLIERLAGTPEGFTLAADPDSSARERWDRLEALRQDVLSRQRSNRAYKASQTRPIGRHTIQNRIAADIAHGL